MRITCVAFTVGLHSAAVVKSVFSDVPWPSPKIQQSAPESKHKGRRSNRSAGGAAGVVCNQLVSRLRTLDSVLCNSLDVAGTFYIPSSQPKGSYTLNLSILIHSLHSKAFRPSRNVLVEYRLNYHLT